MGAASDSRILRVVSLLLTICSTSLTVRGGYSGGEGTAEAPYRIATTQDLIRLSATSADWDKHFTLVTDIDLDPAVAGGRVFDRAVVAPVHSADEGGPQGPAFRGTFNGKGHVIRHLTLCGDSYVGLFGMVDTGGQVRDLGIVDANIAGTGWVVGILAGESYGSVIDCYSTGVINGHRYVGGLTGLNAGAIVNCYCTAAVGGYEYVGGLAGVNYSGNIVNSYSVGAVSGELHTGGLIGDHDNSTVTNCFWDVQTSSLSESSEGTGLATAQMQDTQTYADAGWDLAGRAQDGTCEVWQMPQAGAYPVLAIFRGYTPPRPQGQGTPKAPYRISVAADLAAVYYDPCVHFRLAASLDLSGIHWSGAVFPWFAGTLDGNDMTISHLTVKGGTCLGLFGQLTSGAEIRNVALTDVNVAGSGPYTGGLAGRNDGGRVTCCSCAGAIGGDFHVGGLVGDNIGTISDSHSSGQVNGNMHLGGLTGRNDGRVIGSFSSAVVDGKENAGGLVGYNTGDLYRSYSTGTVHGVNDVGGLIGNNYADVRNCHSTATVDGRQAIGGLVGGNDGSVTGSFSAGPVSAKTDTGGLVGNNSGGIFACSSSGPVSGQENIGGLVGHNSGEGSVSGPDGHHDVYSSILCSYSTGPVTGDVRIGGLVGSNAGTVVHSYSVGPVIGRWKAIGGLIGYSDWLANVSHCFWDMKTSRQSTSDGGSGLTTAMMQDERTFLRAGWDFLGEASNGLHQTWQMPTGGGYPTLSILDGWEPATLEGQGTLDDPYLISTVMDLASLVYHSRTASYRLMTDLDLAGITWSVPVIPLFRGRFDGNDFAIPNLTISGVGYLGLFGRLSDRAEVRDLAVPNARVWGMGSRIGILAGHNQESRVVNCHSTGEVGGYDCIGGLIGSSYWGAVADSGSHVTVTGYSLIGGLIGDNIGSVNNSRSSGVVEGEDYTGGLVGLNEGISVSASYSTAKVHGRAFVGGLIGSNWFGDIADCYCTGSAAGLESVGGLAGQNTGAISHCYSIGVPAGDIDIGGLIGRNSGGITASLWNTETSGKGNACGSQTVNAWGCDVQSGKTTAEMQTAATFLNAGWDFFYETANGTDDLWWLIEGHDYPRLFWQLPADGSDMD